MTSSVDLKIATGCFRSSIVILLCDQSSLFSLVREVAERKVKCKVRLTLTGSSPIMKIENPECQGHRPVTIHKTIPTSFLPLHTSLKLTFLVSAGFGRNVIYEILRFMILLLWVEQHIFVLFGKRLSVSGRGRQILSGWNIIIFCLPGK